jgi:hypothetical protein
MSIINANSGGIFFTADNSGNVAISSNGVIGVTVPTNGGIIISSWDTGTRPSSPSDGQVGFNTDLNTLEQYDGSAWIGLGKVLSIPEYNFLVNTGNPNITSTSCNNIAIGQNAGYELTTGDFNNFLGCRAGYCNTTGSSNNFFGRSSGQNNTSGSNNNFIGLRAGFCNTTGIYNNFFGLCAGYLNTSGSFNFFAGVCAGLLNTTGKNNNFIGCVAGGNNTIGSENNFVGSLAGFCNSTGSYNNFIGSLSGFSNANGFNNNFFGRFAGLCNISGNNNIFFGLLSGCGNNTGSNNLLFGCYSGVGLCGLCNITTQSNHIIMGNSSHTNALIQVAWTAVSDIRDKCVFGPVPYGKNFLNNVNPISFSFKNRETNIVTDTKKRYGFSAQELLQLEGDEPVLVGKDNPEKLMITTDYLIPILVNAIKELSSDVEKLMPLIDEVNILKEKIKILENK